METDTGGNPIREIVGMVVSRATKDSPSKLVCADEQADFVGYDPN